MFEAKSGPLGGEKGAMTETIRTLSRTTLCRAMLIKIGLDAENYTWFHYADVVILAVIFAECNNECCYAGSNYVGCSFARCCHTESHHAVYSLTC